ncbi:hypothetical protein BgiMline_001482 [Biomphalaria glabrata]
MQKISEFKKIAATLYNNEAEQRKYVRARLEEFEKEAKEEKERRLAREHELAMNAIRQEILEIRQLYRPRSLELNSTPARQDQEAEDSETTIMCKPGTMPKRRQKLLLRVKPPHLMPLLSTSPPCLLSPTLLLSLIVLLTATPQSSPCPQANRNLKRHQCNNQPCTKTATTQHVSLVITRTSKPTVTVATARVAANLTEPTVTATTACVATNPTAKSSRPHSPFQ